MKIVPVAEFENIKVGGQVTFNGTIISNSGFILFNKDDKATVAGIEIVEGFWSRLGYWVEPVLHGVKLADQSGIYTPRSFYETSK